MNCILFTTELSSLIQVIQFLLTTINNVYVKKYKTQWRHLFCLIYFYNMYLDMHSVAHGQYGNEFLE